MAHRRVASKADGGRAIRGCCSTPILSFWSSLHTTTTTITTTTAASWWAVTGVAITLRAAPGLRRRWSVLPQQRGLLHHGLAQAVVLGHGVGHVIHHAVRVREGTTGSPSQGIDGRVACLSGGGAVIRQLGEHSGELRSERQVTRISRF